MISISKWASRNKFFSRSLLIISITALNFYAGILGICLFKLHLEIPIWLSWIPFITILGATIIYPSRKFWKEKMHDFYKKRIRLDVLIYTSAFCLLLFNVNSRADKISNANKDSLAQFTVHTVQKEQRKNWFSFKKMRTKFLKKTDRICAKIAAKILKRVNPKSEKTKILLFLLALLSAGALIMLSAAASCSLACSGDEVLAVLVLIGGIGLSIYILVRSYRWLWGKKKQKSTGISYHSNPSISSAE